MKMFIFYYILLPRKFFKSFLSAIKFFRFLQNAKLFNEFFVIFIKF
jgi:hypothetical protein